ncbi:MAG: sulfatase-like hydrolase/transferase [Bacteroidia bacterium]|nr:sulfatase-like hydrolase/transferase [Bacteroidia bacterium]
MYLNIIFMSYFAIELYQYISLEKLDISLSNTEISQQKIPMEPNGIESPDIYFIVFDSYTNNNNLKKYWGFENSDISDYLENKGFWVSDAGASNYNGTEFSIAATMNASYININVQDDLSKVKYTDLLHLIQNNQLLYILKDLSYGLKEFSVSSPKSIPHMRFHVIENLYYRTFLYLVQEKIFGVKEPDYWNVNSTITKNINSLKNEKGPFLVYAHYSFPHFPYLFDSTGKKITDKKICFDITNKHYFLNQLKYTNQVMKEVVKSIFEIDKKSIIIIQGDHGFRLLTDESSEEMAKEGYSVFNAIYLPNGNYTGFPDTMTTVNTFRYVFNNYFNTSWVILENKKIKVFYPELFR